MKHDEIEELLGAYALDAVDTDERDLVEAHLVACPRCRAEVAGYRETAAMLAFAGERAPDGVWDRIVESLEEPPPALALDRVRAATPARYRIGGNTRRVLPLRAAAGIVGIAAALVIVLGVQVVGQERRIAQLATEVQRDAVREQILAAALDPDTRRVTMRSGDQAHSMQALLTPDGQGYIVEHNLPTLPAGRAYQLWGQVGEAKVSLGVLGAAPRHPAFHTGDQLLALAVTVEDASGSEQPTTDPVVAGWVPPSALDNQPPGSSA